MKYNYLFICGLGKLVYNWLPVCIIMQTLFCCLFWDIFCFVACFETFLFCYFLQNWEHCNIFSYFRGVQQIKCYLIWECSLYIYCGFKNGEQFVAHVCITIKELSKVRLMQIRHYCAQRHLLLTVFSVMKGECCAWLN